MRYDTGSATALLARTPAVLRAMLQGLPAEWLDAPERPGAWSPREVACHLADLEHDAWLPRVRTILQHGTARPVRGVERERFRERYAGAPVEAVLDDFQAARAASLRALDALEVGGAALAAVGRHELLGEIRLSEVLSTWVVHDLTHLAQVSRALAAQYRDEVGAFAGFLSILRHNITFVGEAAPPGTASSHRGTETQREAPPQIHPRSPRR
jgi:hypothetical protein